MIYTWNRAFAEGRETALVGAGPERLLDALNRLLIPGAALNALVEIPLGGEARYDLLVPVDMKRARCGGRLREPIPEAQAVIDWAAGIEAVPPNLFLEQDDAGGKVLSGYHCKIEGRLELAEGFFAAMGEPWRAEALVKVARRLPEGWICLYAAAFPHRASLVTRMETMVFSRAARAAAGDISYLARCFDELGFGVYDEKMLEDVVRLTGVGVPITMQFDISPEGDLLPTFSLVSNYEHIRHGFSSLFESDGDMARACCVYEAMGVADSRWKLAEDACFAVKRTLLTSNGIEVKLNRCSPACTKAKWENGSCAKSKIYFILEARNV